MGWFGLRLLPRDENFFELFDRAVSNVEDGARLLSDLVERYRSPQEKVHAIKEVEHRGDDLTHEAVERLNRTFITPLDREDIHALVSGLDDILDFIDAAASRMLLYQIRRPTPEARALAECLERTVEEVAKAVRGLRTLRQGRDVLHHCIEINRLENEGDQIHRSAVARLFKDHLPPLEVIKWKEIYENIETAIDKCEDVANVVEGVILKNV